MKKVILFLFVSVLVTSLFTSCNKDEELLNAEEEISQNAHTHSHSGHKHDRTCGLHAHMDELLEDPAFRAEHEAKFERLNKVTSSRAVCSSPVIIPVAVHFQSISNPDKACLIALAQSQIDILNEDYQGTNSDISSWNNVASNFPGISNGEACIEFCIATKNHPSGHNLSNGDKAVTFNTTSGDQVNDWSGYLNIFVRANTGVLGYSPLGGSGNGDGVVIDANAFGTGSGCGAISPNAPYTLGRTLTHELGHYLLLDHIWGGGCNVDDGVADTPSQDDENYGCPAIGITSCGSKDMFMNYMDYVDDACMYMFSAGQATRMENYVASSLQNLVNNAANVCETGGGGGGTPTCNDGVQNGDETGVDCGGSCAPCQTTSTCNDGIQNGTETGVDCGGSCAPCQTQGCVAPNIPTYTLLSSTSAKLEWNAIAGAKKYLVKYRVKGTSQWSIARPKWPQVTLAGLQPNTKYQYKVKTKCNDGSVSDFTPTRAFTTSGSGGGSCTDATLNLTLDNYGSETTWTLKNASGTTVASGGAYQDGQSGTTISDDFCLADGCYTFRINDSYGDGICCYEGNGEYEIVGANGTTYVSSTGEFGAFEEQDFCVTNGVVSNQNLRTTEKTINAARSKK